MNRDEEKKLLDDWFASVSFTDEPKPSMPAPDPDDEDDDYTSAPLELAHVRGYTRRSASGKVVNVREYDTRTRAQQALQNLALRHVKSSVPKWAPVKGAADFHTETGNVPLYLTQAAPPLQAIIRDQAEKLLKENPGLEKQVKAIKVQPFTPDTEAGRELLMEGFADAGLDFDEVLGFQSLYDGTLYLNGTHFGSMEAARDTAVQQPDGWFSVPVHTEEQLTREVMTHELGHSANRVWEGEEMDRDLQEILKEEGLGHGLPDGSTKISSTGIRSRLSEYGARSQYEFVAEAWTEFNLSPHPRTIAAKVGKILRERLAKGKKGKGWGLPAPQVVQRGHPLRVTTGSPSTVLRFREHLPEEVIWTWPSTDAHEWQSLADDEPRDDPSSDD